MIETVVLNNLRRFRSADGPILVAVSGGIDSTVLLHALARLAPEHAIACVVGHVNHGLRGAESDADEASVRERAAQLGLRALVARVDPVAERVGHVSRTRPTLQEAARRLRYEALRKLASEAGAHHIATAHNRDDQAETVMMRLLRGCGPDGLGGIPERSPDGVVLHPLLEVSRSQIADYAAVLGLDWREDASNDDLRYTRNHLRSKWIPSLSEAFNPRLSGRLAELAEAHRRDAEWIDGIVADASQEMLTLHSQQDAVELSKEGWDALPEALARRLVRRALREMGCGRDLTRVHLERTLDFLRAPRGARGGALIELPGGLRLVRERSRYLLTRVVPLG